MKYYMDEMKAMKPWDTQDENFKQDEHGNWYVEDKEAYMTGDMNEYIWLADELKESE